MTEKKIRCVPPSEVLGQIKGGVKKPNTDTARPPVSGAVELDRATRTRRDRMKREEKKLHV